MNLWLFIIVFFIIVFLLSFINYKVNKDFKIETSWLAIALSPLVIWLLTTGQLSEFSGFGLAFKLEEISAQPLSIQDEGDYITPAPVSTGEKESMSKIPRLIEQRAEAITLIVGKDRYYSNWAIQEYLRQLTPNYFFKFVLFTDSDGVFKGLSEAGKLLYEMEQNQLDLVYILESEDISKIPNLIVASVSKNSSKSHALSVMENENISLLPTVNTEQHFVGIVERGKITSSIVAQLVPTK